MVKRRQSFSNLFRLLFHQNPKNPPCLTTNESFHLLVKPIEIAQVEVTPSVNVVSPTELEEKLITVKDGQPSNSSSFSNPIYSHLCPPFPPALPLTAGNLETCDANRPHGPSSCHSDKITRQDEDLAILKLLSEGNCKATFVISDYEKVEREETDRIRLQSLDSGMCSTEEVSQESLEADSITKSGDEIEEEEDDFQKLFGGEDVLDKGSIQVCSGYEQFQKMPSDTSELLSMDSGFTNGGCGQLANHNDSLTEEEEEDQKSAESMLLLDSPHAPVSRCITSALLSVPLNLPRAGFGGSGEIEITLMPSDRAVSGIEPSADEYLQVRWGLKTEAAKL